MRRQVALSMIDQGMTSAFNMGLGLTFVMFASAHEFGQLVVVQALLLVPFSIQGPLVLSPANFLLPGRPDDVRHAQLAMLTSVNTILATLAALIGLYAGLMYLDGRAALLAVALYASATMRDYARTVFFVQGEVSRAMLQNAVYVGVATLLTAGLWSSVGSLQAAVTGMAAGSILAWALVRPRLWYDLPRIIGHLDEYRTVWKETRWSLLGSLQTEAQTRGYVYIVEAWRGSAALGALQSGRLLLAPLALAVGAWGRVAQPKMVAALHGGNAPEALRALATAVLATIALTLIYGATLAAGWPLVDAHVFGDKYGDLSMIAVLWWLHSGIYCVNLCMATFVQARRQFRRLAGIVAVAAGSSLLALFALSLTDLAVHWTLYVLIGGEAIMMVGLLATVLAPPMIAGHRQHQPLGATE